MQAVMHDARRNVKCLLHKGRDYFRVMQDAASRLKQARERAGYSTAKSAAEAMGVAVATYLQHENGTRGFPATKAERYAKFFRVAPEWILYGKATTDKLTALGPQLFVIGEVQAGVFKEAWKREPVDWEAFTGRPDIVANLSKRFGLIVQGQSMDLIYPPGTILECVEYEGQEIPSGKRVIVQRTKLDGTVEATVKEYVKSDDGTEWLVPRSSQPRFTAFRGDRPDSPEISSVEIIGIVVASIRRE